MAKAAATQSVVASMPFNRNKLADAGLEAGLAPSEGAHVDAPADVTGSTLSESNVSAKTGQPADTDGYFAPGGSLERVRVNGGGQVLTTNQGVAVADNQNSLKAGLRGPTLLEDFILREKITHFDHERIPERIVHARVARAAHGYFECVRLADSKVTKAALRFLHEKGKRTPVFVRFSHRGSASAARPTPRATCAASR